MLSQAEALADARRGHARRTEHGQGLVPVALGEPAASGIPDQRMMAIAGHGEAQQCLEQALHVGRRKEILAPGHEGDALGRVVRAPAEVRKGGR